MSTEIYHSGERIVQEMAHEVDGANANGKVIVPFIIKGAINFIEKQPMVIVSSMDATGNIWASLLVGDFGFIKVAAPGLIEFNKAEIISNPQDVFFENLTIAPRMGVLFIELSTRRRFRVNGQVTLGQDKISLEVREAYPNCPQYIQRRTISLKDGDARRETKCYPLEKLGQPEQDWIISSDTFFIGSSARDGKMDASHRGGNPGFVEFIGDKTLKIPDYHGNSMFNTLGNIVENPVVGLLFIDFAAGSTLQLSGKAQLLFDQTSESDLQKSTGTGRFWLFTMERGIISTDHHSVNWDLLDYSPFNP